MLPAYSPKEVKVALNINEDSIALTGFAPSSFIRLKRNSPLVNETVGLSGELATSIVKDKTGEIELEFMQTSLSNLLLSEALGVIEAEGTPFTMQLIIQDPSGSVLAEASNVFFKNLPNVSMGSEQSTRTWILGCELLSYEGTPAGYEGDDGLIGIVLPTLPF